MTINVLTILHISNISQFVHVALNEQNLLSFDSALSFSLGLKQRLRGYSGYEVVKYVDKMPEHTVVHSVQHKISF